MTVTFEQVREQRDRLEQWVLFIEDLASDEWTDYLRSLYNAGSGAVGMDEENAKKILDLVEAEIKRAREDFIEDYVENAEGDDMHVREVYERLCETGKRSWPRKPTNGEISEQLARCGNGDHEAPWLTDELVKLAKMLREKGWGSGAF